MKHHGASTNSMNLQSDRDPNGVPHNILVSRDQNIRLYNYTESYLNGETKDKREMNSADNADNVVVDAGLFCYLLGSFIVEEKKKTGFVLTADINEPLYKLFTGFYFHEYFRNSNLNSENIHTKHDKQALNAIDVD